MMAVGEMVTMTTGEVLTMMRRDESGDIAIEEPQKAFGGSAGAVRRRRAVFIADFVHLDRPFDEMAARLFDSGSDWLESAERSASWQHFSLTAGETRRSGSSVIVPVRLEPQIHERLLPVLEADVELSSLGDGYCRLSMSGRYRVPFAQLGVAIDRLAMHRVAEMAVRRFLSDVARTLESV
jgi:hypothetical protein